MRSLKESLLDDDLVGKTDKMIRDEIKEFLKQNYNGHSNCKISKEPNQDGKYEVSSSKNIGVKNNLITSLTNDTFIWTDVNGSFIVRYCKSLKSLEGAPKEVGRNFDCVLCESLESLDGAPKEVGGDFDCSGCLSLKTLEGAPEEVGGNFYCRFCKSLESLDGAPKEVGGDFDCSGCKSLKSLESALKEVGGDFDCRFCKIQFTKDDVKKISNVKRNIKC